MVIKYLIHIRIIDNRVIATRATGDRASLHEIFLKPNRQKFGFWIFVKFFLHNVMFLICDSSSGHETAILASPDAEKQGLKV